ncbi:MAG: MBL fold metallo-hydrolase [bacterium]
MQGRVTSFPDIGHIRVVSIPLPLYSVLGTANVYALGDRSLTLIDTGPKFPGSFDQLMEGLEQNGKAPADIDRILLTHGHLDHFGLVRSIREAAGRSIPCYIHTEDLWRVGTEAYQEMWSREAESFMALVDMPPREVERIRKRFQLFGMLCDPVEDALAMEDGDLFEGEGYRLEVLHTPGHSAGACCLYDRASQVLFSGDHILKHITPNPLVELHKGPFLSSGYRPLRHYLDSLEKLTRLEVRHVFPGHGAPIHDLAGIVASYREHHDERKELVWRSIRKQSRPVYGLIEDVFPAVPEDDVFLAVSEILVHLELLIEEGRVELSDQGPPALFRTL